MCLVSTRISHLITGQAIWALPLGHYLCVFSDARSLITDSIFSHLKPLLNCSLLILSYYFSWQLNKIVTANFSRCSRIPRANARVPATPKNFPNRIERSTFCRDIKWTKTDSEHIQQKDAKWLFRTQMCTYKNERCASSYEKFEGAEGITNNLVPWNTL